MDPTRRRANHVEAEALDLGSLPSCGMRAPIVVTDDWPYRACAAGKPGSELGNVCSAHYGVERRPWWARAEGAEELLPSVFAVR